MAIFSNSGAIGFTGRYFPDLCPNAGALFSGKGQG